MIGLLARKLPLALITLLVLSLVVFFGGQLLPGDVGRAVLGPLADARAGMVEALDADYTRTAILKGLSPRVVMMRHVLRNALAPSITVSASVIGYLAGGLVVVETLFHYQGVGSLIYTAARQKDFPMLEAGVLLIGAIYTLASLVADLIIAALNPRLRAGAPA